VMIFPETHGELGEGFHQNMDIAMFNDIDSTTIVLWIFMPMFSDIGAISD
jgi:hypothetical protein